MRSCCKDKEAMPVFKGSTNLCVLVNLGRALYLPVLVICNLYQTDMRKGTQLSVFYMSPVRCVVESNP